MFLDNDVRDFLLNTTVLPEPNLELPGARNSSECQKLSNRGSERGFWRLFKPKFSETEMFLDNNVRDFLLSTTVLSESNLDLPGARNSSECPKIVKSGS